MKTAWDHLPQYLRSLPEPRRRALEAGLKRLELPLEDLNARANAMWRGFLHREIQGAVALEHEPAWVAWGLGELGWPRNFMRQFAPGLGAYLRRRGTRAALQQLLDQGLGCGVVTLWERMHPDMLPGRLASQSESAGSCTPERQAIEPDGGPADWVTLQWHRAPAHEVSREDVRAFLIQEMPLGVQLFVVEEGLDESHESKAC